jgi:hypothetical protein
MFNHRDLSVLNYANGFSMWHYKAKCSYFDMIQPGYFAAAADMFSNGDMLIATGETWASQSLIRVAEGRVSLLLFSKVNPFSEP